MYCGQIMGHLLEIYQESTVNSSNNSWWRHQMETFSALLALCAGNSPVTGEFPTQRPVTRSFDVCFDLRVNKWLSKQSWGWWFETPASSLWRHCNVKSWWWIRVIYLPICFSVASLALRQSHYSHNDSLLKKRLRQADIKDTIKYQHTVCPGIPPVAADGPAPLCARVSAGTVMTMFVIFNKCPVAIESIKPMLPVKI